MEKKKKTPSDRRLKKMFRANKAVLLQNKYRYDYEERMRKLFTLKPIVIAVRHACNAMRGK